MDLPAPPAAVPAPDPLWFRKLLEHAQDVITVLGDDGRILYDSPSVSRVLGYAQGELVGRNAFELIHPEELPAAVALLMDTVAHPGRVSSLTVRFRHRAGGWCTLESVGTRMCDRNRACVVVSSRAAPEQRRPAPAPSRGWGTPELEVLERLARAAELRDDDTGRHTRRVGDLAARVARALGLGEADVGTLQCAAPLHDVGKIGIPDAILRKPGPLSGPELQVMRSHAELGASLLAGGESSLLRAAEEIALCHHERWDGGGYPRGLPGRRIPLFARIVAVADCYDALSHDRPYRGALPPEQCLAYVRDARGTHFDPEVVDALLRAEPPRPPRPPER